MKIKVVMYKTPARSHENKREWKMGEAEAKQYDIVLGAIAKRLQ